jgi:UDP-N-acetylmuramyl pentapeptide synthase
VLGVVGDARWFLEPFTKRGVETAFCEDVEAAATLLMSRLLPGDVVLVKASRSVRAERIVERLRERGGSPT